MPKLIIKPSGTVIEVSEGQDLLSVLRENNLYVKSSCGGHATCSDCIVCQVREAKAQAEGR